MIAPSYLAGFDVVTVGFEVVVLNAE